MNQRQTKRVAKAINKCRNEILAVVGTLTPMQKQQIGAEETYGLNSVADVLYYALRHLDDYDRRMSGKTSVVDSQETDADPEHNVGPGFEEGGPNDPFVHPQPGCSIAPFTIPKFGHDWR